MQKWWHHTNKMFDGWRQIKTQPSPPEYIQFEHVAVNPSTYVLAYELFLILYLNFIQIDVINTYSKCGKFVSYIAPKVHKF